MSQELYSKITDALVQDGYIVINNAINPQLTSDLLNLAKKSKNFRRAAISRATSKQINPEKRRDKILWMDYDNGVQSQFLDFSNGLKDYLNRELFMCITYYESHFAIYEEGDFYETHLDAFKNSKNRVVTTVYYLNDEWKEENGGELVVYDDKNSFLKKVIPQANTLVVFLSEKFPHEVLAAKRKRYSIAGWFRVDKLVLPGLDVIAI